MPLQLVTKECRKTRTLSRSIQWKNLAFSALNWCVLTNWKEAPEPGVLEAEEGFDPISATRSILSLLSFYPDYQSHYQPLATRFQVDFSIEITIEEIGLPFFMD